MRNNARDGSSYGKTLILSFAIAMGIMGGTSAALHAGLLDYCTIMPFLEACKTIKDIFLQPQEGTSPITEPCDRQAIETRISQLQQSILEQQAIVSLKDRDARDKANKMVDALLDLSKIIVNNQAARAPTDSASKTVVDGIIANYRKIFEDAEAVHIQAQADLAAANAALADLLAQLQAATERLNNCN